MRRGTRIDSGSVLACDLSRGMTIEYVVNTPDGPLKVYPVLTKVIRHPSDTSSVRIRGTVPGHATMPPFRIHERLPFDAPVAVTYDDQFDDQADVSMDDQEDAAHDFFLVESDEGAEGIERDEPGRQPTFSAWQAKKDY